MSKGSNRRPTDSEKYSEGWDRIFGQDKVKPDYSTMTEEELTREFDKHLMKLSEAIDKQDKEEPKQ